MVFGSGRRSTILSGSYVSHHDCHLSNSSYALLLAENTWQLGMNSFRERPLSGRLNNCLNFT